MKSLEKKLEKFGVNTVYLFGSQALKKATSRSDYDIAVLFDDSVSAKKYFDYKMKLISLFAEYYKTSKIDLVILNQVPPVLGMNIIAQGVLLMEKKHAQRVDMEVFIMTKYLDRLPYEQRYAEHMLKSL